MSALDELSSDYERASALVHVLIDRATGGSPSDIEFVDLRGYFVKSSDWAELLPRWFVGHRSLNQFWQFIQARYPTYAERRQFLWTEFAPLLSRLETGSTSPAEDDIEDGLKTFNSDEVSRSWRRMIYRVANDPEGAITASRNLLETVLKHILDERSVTYGYDHVELADLYKLVQKELNLAPEQHQEQIFKQILGGCSGIVNGLGAMRNKLGDAHGVGSARPRIRPAPRHARLAVNLAGSMSLFLTETYLSKSD